jgi:hypothetical protein
MKTFSRARLGSLHRLRAHSGRSRALSPGPRVGFCRYEDCYRASGVCSPRSPQHRRANCEGAPKVDGRRSEGGKGARKVDGRCFGQPAGRRELRGLVASCSKATSEGPPKVDGRRLSGTEGGAKAGTCDRLTNLTGGNCMNNFARSSRNLLASYPFRSSLSSAGCQRVASGFSAGAQRGIPPVTFGSVTGD